jgi:eukaryotic-like serine/threonine-protein kinase
VQHATAAPLGQPLVLGRYRPLRPLGSGGSGSVWLAHDEASGLEVALKIVAREGKSAERAEREALAASRLRHERCLRAYALAHDSSHVYIAYEYVPGRTVREALRAGELDDAAAVEAAAQILDGLAHAHSRGIVHRDVKPSNVLLADGPEISVRLLDFGLAQMEEADTLTAFGDVPGTLAYISPERLAGDIATPASDVWAVGVLLWEALAGGHPFWKSGLLESAQAIRAGAPPLAAMRPDLPRELLAAVDRALSPDPGRRPSASALADALRGSRQRERRRTPILGGRPTVADVAPRTASAVLVGLAAGGGAAVLPFFPPHWPLAIAAAAAACALVRPRIALGLALAAPVLPLGNVALGLAVLYGAVALAWLAAFAREPRWALVPALGPLLGPVGALALLPLAARPLHSHVRRALAAGGAVLVAALVAGARGAPLPLTGELPPLGIGIGGSDDPAAVGRALVDTATAHPQLALVGLALAAGAAVLPHAEARGLWGIAGFGAVLLAALLLAAPAIPALPVVLSVWALCATLVAWTGSYTR